MQFPVTPAPRLNVEEAAAHLHISPSFLNRARCRGDGPIFLKIGTRVVYDVADLDAWLASKRHQSTSERAA
jgi:hypothetical protein